MSCAFSLPPEYEMANAVVSCNDVESICVSWIRKSDPYSQFCTEAATQYSTQLSKITNIEDESLMCMHIKLNKDFTDLCPELLSGDPSQEASVTHSLWLVFQNEGVVERTLHKMGYPTHSVRVNKRKLIIKH